MRNSNAPFARTLAMVAALAAAAALAEIGPYESRGKGGKRPHRSVGTKAFLRAAAKRRNKKASNV
jgi:hypothetical protein